jgi:hypothetical protein
MVLYQLLDSISESVLKGHRHVRHQPLNPSLVRLLAKPLRSKKRGVQRSQHSQRNLRRETRISTFPQLCGIDKALI